MRAKVKDINFLPERIVLARKRKKKIFQYSMTGILIFVIMGLVAWLPFQVAGYYEDKLAGISREINILEPAKPYYEEKEALIKDLHNKEQALQEIKEKQLKITGIMQQINLILPPNCFVKELKVKAKEEFNIQVVTNSPLETARVLVGLRQMNLFEKVELAGAGDVPFTEGPKPVTFKLKFTGTGDKKEQEDIKEPAKEESLEEKLDKARTLIEEQNK